MNCWFTVSANFLIFSELKCWLFVACLWAGQN